MNDADFNKWLKDQNAVRVILVNATVKTSSGSIVTRRISNRPFVSSKTDTPPSTPYIARLIGGIKYTQSISIDGGVTVSFGDLEINNADGELDSWIDDYWSNRELSIYVGDASWNLSDFRKVVSGTIVGINTRNRNTINIKLSDKLQRLNTPITENLVGGSTKLSDSVVPLTFGECHNIEPFLVDPTIQKYKVHDGAIESIIEVRDNGVPVVFTPNLSDGTFVLSKAPAGRITCSAQGAKFSYLGGATQWHTGIAQIVYHLATQYGNPSLKFTQSDFDITKLNTFASANQQPIGCFIKDRSNLLQIINDISSSVGSKLTVDANGLAYLVKLDITGFSPQIVISEKDTIEKSIEIDYLPDVNASVKIGYCKNYTIQENLQSGILAEHAALFAEQWLTKLAEDNTAASNYNLFTEPVISETLLLTEADANAEATRRLNLFNVQRKIIKLKVGFNYILASSGQSVLLTNRRFGLSSGKQGQILSISTDFISSTIDIIVIV